MFDLLLNLISRFLVLLFLIRDSVYPSDGEARGKISSFSTNGAVNGLKRSFPFSTVDTNVS